MSRQKFLENYEFIKKNIYLCNSDLNIGKQKFNQALLFGMLSASLKGKTLYVGEYGLGKTTLSETISSVMNSIPLSIISNSSIKGQPELSYEQMIGRPDLGLLNKGTEKVIWSNFVKLPSKVVDEINRIPESKQNILLTGMQSNSWNFLNETYVSESSSWFATANYKDSGNYSIIPPLLDRFDLCLESKNPNINISRILRNKDTDLISYPKFLSKLNNHNTDFNLNLEKIKLDFRNDVKKDYDLDLLTDVDLNNVSNQITNIGFSQETNLFLDLLLAEFSSCSYYGSKRSSDSCPSGCHYNTYSCSKISSPLSVRTQKALSTYSKALAWIDNKANVELDHVLKVAPLVMWHKSFIKEEYSLNKDQDKREDPLNLHITNELVRDVNKRFKSLKAHQEEIITYILNKDFVKATTKAKTMDHPVFDQYVK
jgi:MoxR-like ATPase